MTTKKMGISIREDMRWRMGKASDSINQDLDQHVAEVCHPRSGNGHWHQPGQPNRPPSRSQLPFSSNISSSYLTLHASAPSFLPLFLPSSAPSLPELIPSIAPSSRSSLLPGHLPSIQFAGVVPSLPRIISWPHITYPLTHLHISTLTL